MADKKISALTAASTPLAGTEVLPIVQSGSTVKVAVSDLTAGRAVNASSLTLTGSPLPVASGGTAKTSFNAGQVLYGSFSQTSTFYFDGTNFINGGTSPAARIHGRYQGTGNQLVARFETDDNAGTNLYLDILNDNSTFYTTFKSTGGANGGFKFANASTDFVWIGRDGNIIPKIAGNGINFTANTPAAGMTSQLLNWYEEGTWTPVLSSDGTPPTVSSYLEQTGTYTRIGNRVFVTCNIRATITNAGTGTPVITGLSLAPVQTFNGISLGFITLLTGLTDGKNYIENYSPVGAAFSGATYATSTGYVVFSAQYSV